MIIGFTIRDARLLGLKHYQGKVCKHGHEGVRTTGDRICIECERERSRQRYAADPEKAREYNRQYSQANREKRREQSRQWGAANPEKAREYSRQWREANPEKRATLNAARRARKRNAIQAHLYTTKEVNRAFEECHLVAELLELEFGEAFHVDHVVPLAEGGAHDPTNFQVITATDNRRKHDSLAFNDYQGVRWLHPQSTLNAFEEIAA